MLLVIALIFVGVAAVFVLALVAISVGSLELGGGARRDGQVAAPGARASLRRLMRIAAKGADFVYCPRSDEGPIRALQIVLTRRHVVAWTLPRTRYVARSWFTFVDGQPVVGLAEGSPRASPGGTTEGFSVRVPQAFATAIRGRAVRVRAVARSLEKPGSLALAYSTNGAGNSGWIWRDLPTEWTLLEMEWPAPLQLGEGGYIGVLPGLRGTPEVALALIAASAVSRPGERAKSDHPAR